MIHDYAAQMMLWTGLFWYLLAVCAVFVVWFIWGHFRD